MRRDDARNLHAPTLSSSALMSRRRGEGKTSAATSTMASATVERKFWHRVAVLGAMRCARRTSRR